MNVSKTTVKKQTLFYSGLIHNVTSSGKSLILEYQNKVDNDILKVNNKYTRSMHGDVISMTNRMSEFKFPLNTRYWCHVTLPRNTFLTLVKTIQLKWCNLSEHRTLQKIVSPGFITDFPVFTFAELWHTNNFK